MTRRPLCSYRHAKGRTPEVNGVAMVAELRGLLRRHRHHRLRSAEHVSAEAVNFWGGSSVCLFGNYPQPFDNPLHHY